MKFLFNDFVSLIEIKWPNLGNWEVTHVELILKTALKIANVSPIFPASTGPKILKVTGV